MPIHTNHWWRAHHGISNDAKLQLIALRTGTKRCEVGWVWVILVDFASQNQPRGSISGLKQDEVAIMADIPEPTVGAIMDAMKERGMIQHDGELSSWSKRQPQREREHGDPTAAERQRRRRAKAKLGVVPEKDVTECHGTSRVTERDASVTDLDVVGATEPNHSNVTPRHGGVTVASRDTTVTDRDSRDTLFQVVENTEANRAIVTPCHAQRRVEESRGECTTTTMAKSPPKNGGDGVSSVKRPQKAWYDEQFQYWYTAYWNHQKRDFARKCYEREVNRLVDKDHLGYNQAKLFLLEKLREHREKFEHTEEWEKYLRTHPSTWLNGHRWTDEPVEQVRHPVSSASQTRRAEVVDGLSLLNNIRRAN